MVLENPQNLIVLEFHHSPSDVHSPFNMDNLVERTTQRKEKGTHRDVKELSTHTHTHTRLTFTYEVKGSGNELNKL